VMGWGGHGGAPVTDPQGHARPPPAHAAHPNQPDGGAIQWRHCLHVTINANVL
jgi:hypothetical protein